MDGRERPRQLGRDRDILRPRGHIQDAFRGQDLASGDKQTERLDSMLCMGGNSDCFDLRPRMSHSSLAPFQIVLLTDGGVAGEDERRIFDLVGGKAGDVRSAASACNTTVFTLGIGHGVHRGLVEGMAKKASWPR